MSKTRNERVREASAERRAQQKEELRRAILDAAADLFLSEGYRGLSLRRVAEQIGYSATTIYLYFADKDDLLFTVADEGFERFGAQLRAAAAAEPEPLGRLEAIGRAYLSFGFANPAYYQLMFMERGDFLAGRRQGETQQRISAFDIVRQTIAEGMARGQIRPGDPQAQADALWAIVHGVVAMHLVLPNFERPRAEAAGAAALGLIIAGLRR